VVRTAPRCVFRRSQAFVEFFAPHTAAAELSPDLLTLPSPAPFNAFASSSVGRARQTLPSFYSRHVQVLASSPTISLSHSLFSRAAGVVFFGILLGALLFAFPQSCATPPPPTVALP